MTCLALTHWTSTPLTVTCENPTWLLLVKDYRTGVFAGPVSVLFSSLPHPCFPYSRSLRSRPKKERARERHAPSPLACLPLERSFFLAPTISKRLLRGLLPAGAVTPLYKPYRYLITWNFRDMYISRFWWAQIWRHLNLRKLYILNHFNFAFLSTTIYMSYSKLFNVSLN